MADLRRRTQKNGLEKAILVSKIGFSLVGILSVGVAARLAVPPAAAVLASVLPRLWASLCSWLVPPYLFVLIHLIILVIWKLSDQKQQHRDPLAVEERPPKAVDAIKIKTFEAPPTVPLPRKLSPEIWREILPSPKKAIRLVADSGALQLTDACTGSEEKPAASSIGALTESGVVLEEVEVEVAAAVECIVENDSMEDTWKAIMEKSSPGGEKPAEQEEKLPETVAIRGREPSVTCRDELNRRFDEFIKKNYDQIRLQRHESHQRRSDMINAGSY